MFSRGRARRSKEAEEKEIFEKPKSRRVEKKEEEVEWNKKRILITSFFAVVAILIALELKNMFLGDTSVLGETNVKKASEIKKPDVKTPEVDIESRVGSTVSDIKNNISSLDPEEVATSSPQIQKVLNDIRGIRDLPSNQARQTCMKICSGI